MADCKVSFAVESWPGKPEEEAEQRSHASGINSGHLGKFDDLCATTSLCGALEVTGYRFGILFV